ncbi:MAG: amino acid permease [Planctomycetota bacterium]
MTQKKLGLFSATMVGVGAMVGAGIFVLCGVAMQHAGPGAILAFALCGVLSLLTAFSFAELAAAFPESGGGYVFAKKVFPIGGAFAAGWVLWFAYVVACALYSLGFASFLRQGLDLWTDWHAPAGLEPVVAVATAGVAFALLALRGAGAGDWLSFAKVVAFLVLIGGGVAAIARAEPGATEGALSPFLPYGMTGVIAAMGFVFIALEGYEIIASIAEEVQEPGRTIPRAMFISIGTTLLIYIGLLVVVLLVGGDGGPAWRDLGQRGEQAIAVAAGRYMGDAGAVVVVAAGLLSTFSALTATLLAASRVSYSMARDRALPHRFARIGGPVQSPVRALAASLLLVALVVVATGNVEIAGAAASLIFLLSFALTNAAGLLVRFRGGVAPGYRAPLYPALPILGITACLALAVFQAAVVPLASLVVLAWLVVGGLLYRARFGKRARTVSARTEAMDDTLMRLRGRNPLVLVPVANPDHAEALLRLAHALTRPGIGRVLTLTVARRGPGDDAEEAVRAYGHSEAVLRHAAETSARLERPFEGVVVIASDIGRTIANAVAVRHPETVLLGVSDKTRPDRYELLERIIARTPAEVAVLHAPPQWNLDGVRRILVPVARGTPHDPLRARVLGMLMRDNEREAMVMHVLAAHEDRNEARDALHEQADDLGLPADSCILDKGNDAAEAIIRRSAEADLLIIGFGAVGGRRRLFRPFAQRIIGDAQCPVLAIAHARSGGLF